MDEQPTIARPPTSTVTAARQSSFRRSALWLLVATMALLMFISMLGDVRRKRNAVSQVEFHARTYAQRVGTPPTLPLNLTPEVHPELAGKMIELTWLSREDARMLREADGRVLVAYTVQLPQTLSRNGRAVVFFENGNFSVEWLPRQAFQRILSAQHQTLERLNSRSTP